MHSGKSLPMVVPTASLKEVVVEISTKGLGLVAVVAKDHTLLGIITDGDLRRVLDMDQDIRKLTAEEIMVKNPKNIDQNEMAVVALEKMEQSKISGLIVVNSKNQAIGAFNMHDLFKAKII